MNSKIQVLTITALLLMAFTSFLWATQPTVSKVYFASLTNPSEALSVPYDRPPAAVETEADLHPDTDDVDDGPDISTLNPLAPRAPTWGRVDARPLRQQAEALLDAKREAYRATRLVYRLDPGLDTLKVYDAAHDVYRAELDRTIDLYKAIVLRDAVEELLEIANADPLREMVWDSLTPDEYRRWGEENVLAFVARVTGSARSYTFHNWWTAHKTEGSSDDWPFIR